MSKPSYYAIIPADVRYDKALKPIERLFYGEVSALTNKYGYCTASNSYFSELYDVAPATVSRWVSNLVKRGYLRSEIGADNSRKLYLSTPNPIDENVNTLLTETSRPIDENVNTPIDENVNTLLTETSRPIDENVNTPIDENVKHNNTRFNNKFNNPPYPQNAETETQDCANALADGKPSTGECAAAPIAESKPKAVKQSAPVADIIAAYNEILGDRLPKATERPEYRKRAIAARWKDLLGTYNPHGKLRYEDTEGGLRYWRALFAKVRANSHWMGENDSGWRADLDWFMKPRNFSRLVEFIPQSK